MKIIKQELEFEECLKQRLEFICEFAKVTPTFINGSIRKLEKTNLTYIEPHQVIIKSITFLVFNYSNDVYISNLSKKIKLSELEEYLKKYKNVKKVINIIKDMNIKDKLRLGICLTISDWANILYNRNINITPIKIYVLFSSHSMNSKFPEFVFKNFEETYPSVPVSVLISDQFPFSEIIVTFSFS